MKKRKGKRQGRRQRKSCSTVHRSASPPPSSPSTTNLRAAHGSRARVGLTSRALLSLVVLAGEPVAKHRVKRSNWVGRDALPASPTSRSAREGQKWRRGGGGRAAGGWWPMQRATARVVTCLRAPPTPVDGAGGEGGAF